MVKKIFIVDDEDSIRYTVKTGIEGMDSNYQMIGLESGLKCLQMLQEDHLPDLILLDIMMPEMSGWETYKQIQQNMKWRDIPVIFITARTDRYAREAGEFFGDDYIEKPFEIPELKKRIDKVLVK